MWHLIIESIRFIFYLFPVIKVLLLWHNLNWNNLNLEIERREKNNVKLNNLKALAAN